MTNTLFHYLSTTEKFLLSSTKFWSTLSTVAVISAFSSFYSTHQQYTNNSTTKYISAFIIAFHLIIFLSDLKTLKNTFAPFFLGFGIKWALRFTAMRVISLLYYVPEQSVAGLIFVISVWIDVIAITRIVKPSIDLFIANAVFVAVVSRSIDLYGLTRGHWVIMLLCSPVMFIQFRLKGYKDEETKEKEE